MGIGCLWVVCNVFILFSFHLLQYFNRIEENNMNTEQFSYLFVFVLFKSQGIWLVVCNVFILFSFHLMIGTHCYLHNWIVSILFFLIYYSISIEQQKTIWTRNNFPTCMFLIFLSTKGFDLKSWVTQNNMFPNQFCKFCNI